MYAYVHLCTLHVCMPRNASLPLIAEESPWLEASSWDCTYIGVGVYS